MRILKILLTNGFLLIIPVLIWNLVFTSQLPSAYQSPGFDESTSAFIIGGENFFRIIIFIMPLLFQMSFKDKIQKQGLKLFLIGCFVYCLSWLMLLYWPESNWSQSLLGFSAPALTPVIWLVGLSLMVKRYYFARFSPWHYILPTIGFSIFHALHVFDAYYRVYS
ncbi:hypothetical protein [Aliikangiella sp. IMCC44359]|uniref:hypothetical protein n=1 Tax=Aliikangiella sp. IMCC44359 TaxID=3459125 RepID=UPI00403ABA3D